MKLNEKIFVKFLVSLVLSAAVCAFVICSEKEFSLACRLCDGFFVSGIIFLAIGIILFCSYKGAYNFLGYTFYSVKKVFSKSKKNPGEKQHLTYAEYNAKKNESKKTPPYASLICGILFTLISVVIYLFNILSF